MKNRLKAFWDKTWKIIVFIFEQNLSTHSAATAYYTVLTLAPITTLLIFASSFLPLSSFENLFAQIKDLAGVHIANAVAIVVKQTREPNLRTAAGIFSVLSIFFFGSALFAQLRVSLNTLFKTPDIPISQWLYKRILSIAFMWGAIGILVLSSVAISVLQIFETRTGIVILPFVPLLSGTLLLLAVAALYRWLPDIRLPWPSVIQGAVATTLLMAVGKSLFGTYVDRASLGSAYGASGVLVVFLIWIFYSAFMFYLGAELAFGLKDRRFEWMNQYRKFSLSVRISIVVVGVLVFLRALAPEFVRHEINRHIQNNSEWGGYVEDVDLGVFAGSISLLNVEIYDEPHRDTLLKIRSSTVNLSWLALLKKEFRVDVEVLEPAFLVKLGRPAEEKKETKSPKPPAVVQAEVKEAVQTPWPLHLDEIIVEGGEFRIEDLNEDALPPLRLFDFNLTATNIWNRVSEQEGPSNVDFSAKTSGQGSLKGKMWVSAFAPSLNLKSEMQMQDMNLRFLNKFFKEKANFDLSSGKLDVFVEVATRNWQVDGVIKPLLRDVHFTDLAEQKKEKSFWNKVWEGLLDWLAEVFKNEKTDKMAGRIRFTGRLDDPSVRAWPAFVSLMRNAFFEAVLGGFDRKLRIEPKFPVKKKD